jgi:pimeloyl-ACP methyl ester carboxylesterase
MQPPEELVVAMIRASMCVPRGESFAARLLFPEELPAWLPQADLDYMVAELEHTGLRAPLAWYGNADADWEALEDHADQPLTVPALFVAGDRDITSIWSQDAVSRAHERVKDLRGSVIIEDCGHWMQVEKPERVNQELLSFLQSL